MVYITLLLILIFVIFAFIIACIDLYSLCMFPLVSVSFNMAE